MKNKHTPPNYTVTLKDTFFSGWGECSGKPSIVVIACETKEEADVVCMNADMRPEMVNVRVNNGVDCPFWSNKLQNLKVLDRRNDYVQLFDKETMSVLFNVDKH
jgi:hypothetical protein